MKATEILALIVIAMLFALIFLGVTEMRKEDQLKQSEIRGLKLKNLMDKKAFEHALDSIRKQFSIQLDSVTLAHEESLKANVKSQKEIKILKGIVYVQHTDSSRTATLKELYPSFKP